MTEPDDEVASVFEWMLEIGAIEMYGVRPDGEMSYVFTDKFREMFPDVHESIMAEYNEAVYELWKKDIVSINWVDGEARVWPTNRLFDDTILPYLNEMELDAVYGFRDEYESVYGPYDRPKEPEG